MINKICKTEIIILFWGSFWRLQTNNVVVNDYLVRATVVTSFASQHYQFTLFRFRWLSVSSHKSTDRMYTTLLTTENRLRRYYFLYRIPERPINLSVTMVCLAISIGQLCRFVRPYLSTPLFPHINFKQYNMHRCKWAMLWRRCCYALVCFSYPRRGSVYVHRQYVLFIIVVMLKPNYKQTFLWLTFCFKAE